MNKDTVIAVTQPTLDPTLTVALLQASAAAYACYSNAPITPPQGYNQVAVWTGWDAFFTTGSEEKYGVAFQSADATTLILAFRGTDSDMDAFEDARFLPTRFVPTRDGGNTPTAHVSSGFYGIYNDKGGSMTQSMRQQVFALLDQYKPLRVYVTGHSLGAALCQLFSFDLALSQPIASININFASPMVGTDTWQAAYESTVPSTGSIRVYNYWDYVPTLPPSEFGYRQVGSPFVTSFYVKGEWFPHELSRHSLGNLTTVVSNALPLKPQQWAGEFPDYVEPSRTMLSTVPPAAGKVSWADKVREHMDFERSLRGETRASHELTSA